MSDNNSKLNVCGFGFAYGMAIGLMLLVTGLIAMMGHGASLVTAMGTIYPGYAPTLVGSLLGFVYGFIDGAILGVLVAFFYNMCCCKSCKSYKTCDANCEKKSDDEGEKESAD